MKKIPFYPAVISVLILLVGLLIFHSLLLNGNISRELVWGNRLETDIQIIQFEAAAVLIHLSIILLVVLKSGWTNANLSQTLTNTFLWIFSLLFLVITVGNALSANSAERFFFAPVSLVVSILLMRIALEPKRVR